MHKMRTAGVEVNVVMELRSIGGVRALKVRGLNIRRELALITRRGADLSPAAASFAAQLLPG